MDAVGADQNVAMGGLHMPAVAIEEPGGDAGFVLGERAQPRAGMDARFAEPRPHRLIDHRLEPAAMDRKLREIEAGIGAARLPPDLLAEAVAIEQLVGADTDGIEPRQQAEPGQLPDGMWEGVDADAQLPNLVALLEDLAVDAPGMQHQGGRQSANSPADHNRFHGAHATRNLSLPYLARLPPENAMKSG